MIIQGKYTKIFKSNDMTRLKYNVSDNGIRRWCEHYNLPTSKKYLLEYINRRIV